MVFRKLRKLVGNEKSLQNSPVKAVYSGEAWPPRSSQLGIWSIRSFLSADLCMIMKFVSMLGIPPISCCSFVFYFDS